MLFDSSVYRKTGTVEFRAVIASSKVSEWLIIESIGNESEDEFQLMVGETGC